MTLGLMAFCVTSCNGQPHDVNYVPSVTDDVVRSEVYDGISEKDKLEKQICRDIPIKFEPATIFGHPVSCWYSIYIDPKDVGYHRKNGKEHIFVTRTLKEKEFEFF